MFQETTMNLEELLNICAESGRLIFEEAALSIGSGEYLCVGHIIKAMHKLGRVWVETAARDAGSTEEAVLSFAEQNIRQAALAAKHQETGVRLHSSAGMFIIEAQKKAANPSRLTSLDLLDALRVSIQKRRVIPPGKLTTALAAVLNSSSRSFPFSYLR